MIFLGIKYFTYLWTWGGFLLLQELQLTKWHPWTRKLVIILAKSY